VKHIIAASLLLATALAAVTPGFPATPATLETTELGHGPAIVFVHGLGGGRLQWMPLARKLIGSNRVVLVDLPGHGGSTMPDPFSLAACADAVAELAAKESPDSTILVGQGVGGLIAIKALAAHPGIARGVLVIDTGLKLAQAVPDQMQQYFLQSLDTNYEQMMKPILTYSARDSEQKVAMWASASQVTHGAMKEYMAALLPADESRTIKDLRGAFEFVGTEKLWEADKKWPDLAKSLGYDALGNVDARRLAGAGGLAASDQPDTLAMLLRDFQARALARH
jgi:pimeloyl-ACP methyl ester carboxylesterase